MKQFMIRRVLPMLVVVSMILPLACISVSAAYFPDEFRDLGAVDDWNEAISFKAPGSLSAVADYLGVSSTASAVFWGMVNQTITEVGDVSRMELDGICSTYNAAFTYELQYTIFECIVDSINAIAGFSLASLFNLGKLNFVVEEHPSSGLLRIHETTNDIWVVNQWGKYPYVDPSEEEISGGDQWVSANEVYKNVIRGEGPGGRYTSKGSLESTKDYLVQQGTNCWITEIGGSGMMGITKSGYFFCDEAGRPYFCWETDYQAAVNTDRVTSEIVTESGQDVDVEEGMEVGIDIENGFCLLPSSDIVITGEIIYDPVEKIYNVETHKVNNYTEENYEITTNNYTYEYYIQNTTVTYIGETMDYEKYECYYKLPDGRSSADLTKEELEQLNVGIDVVEYSRSTDDVRLRALYHFDGDTKDSSYWNHLSEFHWHEGATINYMDVETFGGAMYLDANIDSAFSIKLPSSLGAGDFTIQFRYYQSQPTAESPTSGLYMNATPTWGWNPDKDSGEEPLALLTGELLLDEPDGSECEYSVGSWNEICITRKGNTFSYFVNGLCLFYTTWVDTKTFGDTLMFYFGEDMGAYKMIDELRVLNFSIASGKQAEYEPTAVPHDTNLALVLPDDKIAIADEYWTFESSKENLLEQYGLADWQHMDLHPSSNLRTYDGSISHNGSQWVFSQPVSLDVGTMYYNSQVQELHYTGSGTYLDSLVEDASLYDQLLYRIGYAHPNNYDVRVPLLGLYFCLGDGTNYVLSDGTYTFSMVLSNGQIRSLTFTVTGGRPQAYKETSFDKFQVQLVQQSMGDVLIIGQNPTYSLLPSPTFVYMELVEGSSTDLTAIYNGEIAIVDKEDQFKPTLAVRTDLEITDCQIGGVRPSIPEKGLVYAMVESGYITSLQIYNGQAWEACDGRIWTGERWIPYSSYNVITLQDMYDIVDATPDYEYIYTESGFWAWWQKSWNAFTEQLFGLLGSGSGNIGGDADLDDDIPEADPDAEGGATLLEFIVLVFNGGKAVIRGFRDLFSGAVSSVPEAMNSITGAFKPGGVAVSFFEGTDPDMNVVSVMDLDSLDYYQTEEVLDPWRYR